VRFLYKALRELAGGQQHEVPYAEHTQ